MVAVFHPKDAEELGIVGIALRRVEDLRMPHDVYGGRWNLRYHARSALREEREGEYDPRA